MKKKVGAPMVWEIEIVNLRISALLFSFIPFQARVESVVELHIDW
jgi:hypothetical protein